jgi:16S rRNA processing protein RimM
MTDDAFVVVAEVVKAVGLHGEIKLYPLLDWHAPLLGSPYLEWGDRRPLRATAWRRDGTCWVVRLADIDSREAAEATVGQRVGFRRERYGEADFPVPDGGLPFRYLGRQVATVAGELVGRVVEIRRYATQPLLVIQSDRGEVLVPAVPPILRPDCGLEGTLLIDPPPGLLDDAALIDDDAVCGGPKRFDDAGD